jgi:hypothetical protein
VHRRRRQQPCQRLDPLAGGASNEGRSVGGRKPVSAGALRDPEAAAQQVRRGGPAGREANERGGSRRQKRVDDGGDRGAAGSLYQGQAARGRLARSGRAKPKEAAHRKPDYGKKRDAFGEYHSKVPFARSTIRRSGPWHAVPHPICMAIHICETHSVILNVLLSKLSLYLDLEIAIPGVVGAPAAL